MAATATAKATATATSTATAERAYLQNYEAVLELLKLVKTEIKVYT
jgi:hypothetical protein